MTTFQNERIVVTGGRGFIGNELVRQIFGTREVAVLDNHSRLAPRSGDIDGVRTFRVDITDAAEVERALGEFQPTLLIHLAALHFIPECNANPELTLNINVAGTSAVLRGAEKAGVKHVVFASSGAVYADSADALGEDSLVAPLDIYGWSKWFGEELCGWSSARSPMAITVARLFNAYGPRETNAHIVPEIIHQLRQGDTLSLGNIKPRRDYIYVSDMAQGLFRLATRDNPESLEVVNLCSGYHASVEELIVLMAELLGRKIVVETDQARFRAADKAIQVGNNAKLQRLTGWKPGVDLRRGLKELLQFEGLIES